MVPRRDTVQSQGLTFLRGIALICLTLAKQQPEPKSSELCGGGAGPGLSLLSTLLLCSPCLWHLQVSGVPSALILVHWGRFEGLSQRFRSSHRVGSGQRREQVCRRALGSIALYFLFFYSLLVNNR